MSNENTSNEDKANVTEKRREEKTQKELSPQEIQKRKKMLVYPLLFLVFAGVMWLIFAPLGDKNDKQPDGFNSELPVPKDDMIVGDKRTAYEQEAMRNKQEEKQRSLQDFAFQLNEEEKNKQANVSLISPELEEPKNKEQSPLNSMQASTHAYQDVNRQLNSWYEQPKTVEKEESPTAVEQRIEELERKLKENETAKTEEEKQLEMLEKSYQIAAKYSPNGQTQVQQTQVTDNPLHKKVVPEAVSQVHHNVVSLLSANVSDADFLKDYSKPRNMGFITASGNESVIKKNSINACVYQTIKLTDGKEIQLRILEPIRAGNIIIPANTLVTGNTKIGGERLLVTITSIQHQGNVIPVELIVYDLDGMAGFSAPNSDELNAAKEIAANMGTQMGSSITISDDAGSQLLSDMGRNAIQGISQYIGKKMRKVEVTLKANHKVLLLPKI